MEGVLLTVGELFIDIGLKGANKVGEGLSAVKGWMGEVSSVSLETKAAIVGVIYSLEHFMTQSAQMGMALQNFSVYTGQPSEYLQRLAVVGKQAGVSFEEVESSIKGVQKSIAEMQIAGNRSGLEAIAKYVGLTYKDLNDLPTVINKVMAFAKKDDIPIAFRNYFLGMAHMSDDMVALFRKIKPGDIANVPKNLILSDAENNRLAKIYQSWEVLAIKMQRAWDHLTSAHGGEIVAEIDTITSSVVRMIGEFTTLAEKLKVFKVIGMIFEGWAGIFDGINSGVDRLNKDGPKIAENAKNDFSKSEIGKKVMSFFLDPQTKEPSLNGIKNTNDGNQNLISLLREINVVKSPSAPVNNSTTFDQNFNINIHGSSSDTKTIKEGVGHAARSGVNHALKSGSNPYNHMIAKSKVN